MPTGQPFPPPFTSAPLPQLHDQAMESISMGSRMPMDVDWEEELGENDPAVDTEDNPVRRDDEGEGDDEGEREVDVPEDEGDDVGDDGEEEVPEADVVEDPMVVEDEELRKDSRGPEEPAEYDDD